MARFFFGASGSIIATGDYTAKRRIWEGEKTPNKHPLFNGLIWVKIKPFRGRGDDEPEAGPMNVHDLHPQVQEFAAAEAAVLLVYLFGSRASGQAGPGSDYDLGILLDRREDAPARRARLTHGLVVGIERRLDELSARLARLEPLKSRSKAEFDAGNPTGAPPKGTGCHTCAIRDRHGGFFLYLVSLASTAGQLIFWKKAWM
jgi:hypothetical protein